MQRRAMLIGWLALSACGGDDSDSPVEKCDDLVSTLCDRAVECVGGGTQQECEQAVLADLPCGSAQSVAASYPRCMDQLRTFSCGVLFPDDPQTGQPMLALPVECQGVIQVPREATTSAPTGGVVGGARAAAAIRAAL